MSLWLFGEITLSMKICNCCNSINTQLVYEYNGIPIFQNKVFSSPEDAKNVLTGKLKLIMCSTCGYTWNDAFDEKLLNYDENYQNEQANSSIFQNHLDEVQRILISEGFKNKKIVEIGCGKGYFLEKLRSDDFDVLGFDPAYEGDNPYVLKEYFSDKHKSLNADLIILRHVLEHIPKPADFIKQIQKIVKPSCDIYVEVPDMKWIIERNAFWDLHYEHCNYFTVESLKKIFGEQSDHGIFFNGQYQYIISKLGKLKVLDNIEITPCNLSIDEKLKFYIDFHSCPK